MKEIAYELPYAQGLQLIWDYKMCNGENQKAIVPDENSNAALQKKKFSELLG